MTTEREWLERSGSSERPMIRDRRDFLKVTFGSMLAIGASGFLAACGGDDDDAASGSTSTSAGATTTKPVELMKISAMMPFAVGINFIADTAAAAGGFFTDNGLDMNLQFAQSAPLALQQLAAGNVSVIRNAPIAVVKAVSQEGAPFVAIGMPNQEMLYRLVSTEDKPVDDLASLEGKTVGMATLAGNAEDTFVLVLKGAGINPDSVTRVAVGQRRRGVGVRRGRPGRRAVRDAGVDGDDEGEGSEARTSPSSKGSTPCSAPRSSRRSRR